jgi:hypothetical protein
MIIDEAHTKCKREIDREGEGGGEMKNVEILK